MDHNRNPITHVRQGAKRITAPELIDTKDLGSLIFELLNLLERVMVFLDFGGGLAAASWPA
jgi:hypothetical protein